MGLYSGVHPILECGVTIYEILIMINSRKGIPMKLFVSDLDGTLLNNQQKLSLETIETINDLIGKGMQFSIATARSIKSAWELISPLDLRLPVIVHNGVFIYDPITKKNIRSCYLDRSETREILKTLEQHEISPLLYTINHAGVYKVYYQEMQNKGQEDYINDRVRKGDKRFTCVDHFNIDSDEDVITLVAIDTENSLREVYDILRSEHEIGFNFSEDIYTHAYWLEMTHLYANKKNAVLALKDQCGADEIISFGDNINDLPMFDVSSFCCAVSNANEAVKKAASIVIGSNEEHGVAKFLREYA